MDFPLNSLGLTHAFLADRVRPGDFCIDATAGNGHDTAFLCSLVGPTGRVLAFDIQPQAVENTNARLQQQGWEQVGQAVLCSHDRLLEYAAPGTVDAVCFNFGWLPGGDHSVFTTPATSIPAIDAALAALRPGGALSLCLYYGGRSGYAERDAILAHLETLDNRKYTVMVTRFVNRTGDVPIPVFIIKEG